MADYSIYIFHILFVGPLLILIGLFHNHTNFPKIVWDILVILGIGIILYHSFISYKRYTLLNAKDKS
jgi:hypothetical protein